MSRSRKKHPFQQLAANKYMKKIYNRKIRRSGIDIGKNNDYKKHFDSYEICDWLLYEPDNPRSYRK